MAAVSRVVRVGVLAAAMSTVTPGISCAEGLIPTEVMTFKNGFRAFLHVDKRTPSVAVLVNYAVGPRHEQADKTGLAHLFEHLMFRGSEHMLPYSPWWYLYRAGASRINGTTSEDRTNYFEFVPSVNLEPILWMESDRMGFPHLTAADLDAERRIVKNERRQRHEIAPYGAARELVWKTLFPQDHPYHGMVIGEQSHLDAITLDEAKNFFKKYYSPGNATLVLSGDFDLEKARELIRDYFAGLPGAVPEKLPPVPQAVVTKPRVFQHVEKVGVRPRAIMSWLTPSYCTAGNATADILSFIMRRGKNGRFGEERLSTDGGSTITFDQNSMLLQSVFSATVSGNDQAALVAETTRIDQALADIAEHGVSTEELAAAKRWRRLSFITHMQDLLAKASLLIESDACFSSPAATGKFLELADNVTVTDVQEFIRKYLMPSQRVLVYAIPPRKESAR